ncbi:hypothetical protein GE21DRAFT_7407 [Neurospora crassa]|uniref:Uncharacterized protein n=2 Tax=Neurospora crassa TaxID=5141 RepID=Q7S7R2_NEUCR|nr:hypothetical protein NCU03831 [Neurospora crassa OR74A]EAA31984.1 hypothetical protein NCU03831 [Neurospora crassa OR74A]KHE88101.1 hypothetical protein GE21DRAFT_7407 [Neurospora crassa]CAE76108.1 hypothetical protein [Neurospora crassa]|eukprot:XP_961220.1 hypothetical protein NCU03831 [Neurospora crassa OR74A]
MPSTYRSPVDGPHRDSARLLCVPTEGKHKEEKKGPAEISTRLLAGKAAFGGTPSQAEAELGRIILTAWTTAPGHRDSHVDALGRPQIGDFYGYIGDISQPPRFEDPFYGRLGS